MLLKLYSKLAQDEQQDRGRRRGGLVILQNECFLLIDSNGLYLPFF